MKLKTLGYAAIMTIATVAFVLGAAGSSEAKGKKKAMAPQKQASCLGVAPKQVCGSRNGMKFTYANTCFAANDGAKVVSNKACPARKAKMGGKKKMAKAKAAKPAAKK